MFSTILISFKHVIHAYVTRSNEEIDFDFPMIKITISSDYITIKLQNNTSVDDHLIILNFIYISPTNKVYEYEISIKNHILHFNSKEIKITNSVSIGVTDSDDIYINFTK